MGIVIRPKDLPKTSLIEANIGEDYWECDFKNFEGPEKALEASKLYLKKLEEMKEKGIGLLYVGPNGPGKTTLAMTVLKYLARARWDVYAISLGELVIDIQKGWKDENDELSQRCREADFLLIDDVGKEHRGASQFVQTVFDNLIRHRVQHRLPTFLTTNFTKSELEGTYGESVMSLLEGKLLAVVVNGEDYRRKELKQRTKRAFAEEDA